MREETPLKEHLDELNFVLMELRDIDVKMEDEVVNYYVSLFPSLL